VDVDSVCATALVAVLGGLGAFNCGHIPEIHIDPTIKTTTKMIKQLLPNLFNIGSSNMLREREETGHEIMPCSQSFSERP